MLSVSLKTQKSYVNNGINRIKHIDLKVTKNGLENSLRFGQVILSFLNVPSPPAF